MATKRRQQTHWAAPSYPVPPALLVEKMPDSALVERLSTPIPRGGLEDALTERGVQGIALLLSIALGLGVVGVAFGCVAYLAAGAVGGIATNDDRSGVFVDGTGAFWGGVGAALALISVWYAGVSFGSIDSARIRSKLVEYRLAIEEWRRDAEQGLASRVGSLHAVERELVERQEAFEAGYIKGRQWLADAFAALSAERDSVREFILRNKPHPGVSSANVIRSSKAEKRLLAAENRYLRMQVASYEEYFPEIADYRELILDEADEFIRAEALDDVDPVLRYLTTEEYRALGSSDRHQLALDRYLRRPKSDWEIGRVYERQVGWLYETDGWRVAFEGATKGLADFGRDLLTIRDGQYRVIQCKNWSQTKVIREKHIFQLFGTTVSFRLTNGLSASEVTPFFYTTTSLSDEAVAVARELGVEVRFVSLTAYPSIKCNVTPAGERIYHLPFDQMYDRVVIGNMPGECYANSVSEAEALGFRRAFRWRPEASA